MLVFCADFADTSLNPFVRLYCIDNFGGDTEVNGHLFLTGHGPDFDATEIPDPEDPANTILKLT